KKSSRRPKAPKKVRDVLNPIVHTESITLSVLTIHIDNHQKEPLPTTFSCLFCNHENCVIVKLDKKLGLGNLSCKVCGQRFQTGINCEKLLCPHLFSSCHLQSASVQISLLLLMCIQTGSMLAMPLPKILLERMKI